MRVLMLSADPHMLDTSSDVYRRTKAYARELGALDCIVLSGEGGLSRITDGPLDIRATHSRSKLLRGFDVFRVVRLLLWPDVLTVQDSFENGFVAFFIARMRRAPLHLQVHTDIGSAAFARHSFANRIRLLLARFLLPRAARIRVVSERVREAVSRLAPRVPVSVIPVHVDVAGLAERARKEDIRIRFAAYETVMLVVSRLECEKDVGAAITAFAEATTDSACLVIVGEGRERRSLEALARSLGVEHRVFFEGRRDPASYLRAADLLLSTSRYEGYGMAIVEALALGVPVISTDVGIAHEAGAVIAPRDDIAGTIRAWLSGGERKGTLLLNLPSFDDYVRAYAQDIKSACL